MPPYETVEILKRLLILTKEAKSEVDSGRERNRLDGGRRDANRLERVLEMGEWCERVININEWSERVGGIE